MRPSCAMSISEGKVLFSAHSAIIDISLEDFQTMMEMYELITNNYYASDFCCSDEKGEYIVGCLKDQIKEE